MVAAAGDRPLLVLHDVEEGHLVYDLLLLLLEIGSSGDDQQQQQEDDDGEEEDLTVTVACFPCPVARFPLPSWGCSLAVSGGTVLCAKYDWDDTLFHDTAMLAGGYDKWRPRPRCFICPRELSCSYKNTPAMLPMRDGSVIRMDTILFDGIYNMETLRRLDGSWHATPLPKPPIGPMDVHVDAEDLVFLSAYFAAGTRVWISVARRGTFSLDTEHGVWSTEGTGQLPFEGRALYVPELDAVFGLIADGRDPVTQRHFRCACDVVNPGAVRHVWRDSFPWPWEEDEESDLSTLSWPRDEEYCRRPRPSEGKLRPRDLPSLAYLGKGRFCICRPLSTTEPQLLGPQITHNGSCFLVVQVKRSAGGELRLAKRGKTSYMWPPQGRQCPYVGLVQPATESIATNNFTNM